MTDVKSKAKALAATILAAPHVAACGVAYLGGNTGPLLVMGGLCMVYGLAQLASASVYWTLSLAAGPFSAKGAREMVGDLAIPEAWRFIGPALTATGLALIGHVVLSAAVAASIFVVRFSAALMLMVAEQIVKVHGGKA
jgi:hypothetical protein